MFTRIICVFTLLAFVNFLIGCAKTKTVTIESEELRGPREQIVEVVYPDGTSIVFDKSGGHYDPIEEMIVGTTDRGFLWVVIPLDDVLYIKVKRVDPVKTMLATVGVLAIAAAVGLIIVAATKESCPFVYSYDGQQFVFDAEPLGGAICKGLQRTEMSRLEHLRAVDGQYRLMLRNEVEETQYLDEMKLAIVDHSPAINVIADWQGKLHFTSHPVAPSSAVDENGVDLSTFVTASDGTYWQTKLPQSESLNLEDARHQLTFEFPKPADATKARLLVNAGTALWGSNMIREMLQMRGDGVDAWYQGVNEQGPQLTELHRFNLQEELYFQRLWVQRGDEWVERGLISGGGPLIAEDRIVDLDVSDVPGETLKIRLNPPRGFWTLDYIAVEYETHDAPLVMEVPISVGRDQTGADVTDLLAKPDERYYVMEQVGNWAAVEFRVPPPLEETQRSVFLKTTGYYEIQIDKTRPEEKELISRMLTTPGAIVSYAMDEYLKFHIALLARD